MADRDPKTLLRLAAERGLLTPERAARAEEALRAQAAGDPAEAARTLVERGVLTPTEGETLMSWTRTAPEGPGASAPAPPGIDDAETLSGTRPGPAPAPASPAPPEAPAEAARFVPEGLLGRGGMGQVLLARDPRLDREVAIKRLLEPRDEELRRRFLEEAKITGQLEHPNIVPVHELGQEKDSGPYLVMKRVRGRSLSAVLADLAGGKPLRLGSRAPGTVRVAAPGAGGTPASPPEELGEGAADGRPRAPDRDLARLLEIFAKVCEAVAYAHARGVIHRDLKPENVMVGEFGEVLVMDWGLAKPVGKPDPASDRIRIAERRGSPDGVPRTLDGQVVGTPAYMPPEQAEGRPDDIDERSDVYSLGAILYEILALAPPVQGSGPYQILERVIRGEIEPLRSRGRTPWEIPRELEAVVLKAMAKDRAARYGSALELKEEVEAFFAGRRLRAAEYSFWELLGKWARRNRAAVTTGLAGAAVLLVASVLFVFSLARARDEALRQKEAAVAAEGEARRQAERAEAERTRAEAERRQAEIRYAEGLALQADALLGAERWLEAVRGYEQAWVESDRLGLAAEPAEWGLLDAYRRNPPPLLELRLPTKGEVRIAFSPDGSRVLVAGASFPLALFDSWTGRKTREFEGCRASRALLSADGRRVYASSGEIGVVRVDAETGRQTPLLPPEKGNDPCGLALSPDGRSLLAGFENGKVLHIDAEDGRVLSDIKGHKWDVCGLAFSPDGAMLATNAKDRTATVLDTRTGKLTLSLRRLPGYGFDLAFAPDGRRLWICSGNQLIEADPLAGQETRRVFAHAEYADSVAVSPDGRRLLTGGFDRLVRLWDANALRPLRAFQGHAQRVVDVAWAPDGRRAASAAWGDGRVLLWDVEEDPERGTMRGHLEGVSGVALSPDSRQVLSSDIEGMLALWDFDGGHLVRFWEAHDLSINAIALSPDGRRAVSAGTDRVVKVWDLAEGRLLCTLQGHPGMVMSAAFSPDGSRILSGSQMGNVRLWDAEKGTLIRELVGHAKDRWVGGAAFSPDGRIAATAAADNQVILWDPETGKSLAVLRGHHDIAHVLSFTPDGSRLVSASFDQTVRIWDVAGRRDHRVLAGHTGAVGCAASVGDGRRIASSGTDATFRLWDAESGRELHAFRADAKGVGPFSFSKDGAFAVAGNSDCSLGRWDFRRASRYREFRSRLEDASRRLAADPGDAEALRAFGEWYAFRGMWEGAAELLLRARGRGARVPDEGLARSLWLSGRLEEASRAIDEALARGGDPARALRLRTWAEAVRAEGGRRAESARRERAAEPLPAGKFESRVDAGSAVEFGIRMRYFRFRGDAGARLEATLASQDFVPAAFLVTPHGAVRAYILKQAAANPAGTSVGFGGFLPLDGTYFLACGSADPEATGTFTVETQFE